MHKSTLSSPGNIFTKNSAGGEALISSPLEIVSSGIDTLSLSVDAEIPADLILRLKEEREKIQSCSDDCLHVQFGNTDLFSFNLQRTGKKFYPYCLKSGDFSIFLSARAAGSSIPNMQVNVGSISCNNDIDGLFKSFRMWCSYHKIIIITDKVSRIDLYSDLVVDINTLTLFNQAKFVTRAEKVGLYYSNRKLTGLQVGSGAVVMRIYDKLQEMIDKQAGQKIEFFTKKWGKLPSSVTRVEYQLRRESIVSLLPRINNFQAVQAEIPNIWRYLTVNWFRQTSKAVDRLNRNQGRETTSHFWSSVQMAFDAPSHFPSCRNRKQKIVNVPALVRQAAGIMTTVCAALGVSHEDIFSVLGTASEMIRDSIFDSSEDPLFARDYRRRAVSAVLSF